MIIHNATFMVIRERESDVISWLRKEIEDLRSSGTARMGEGSNPRISAMREAGGISHEHADAASVAFQLEFPDIASAKIWGERVFNPLADRFTAAFGEESMVFTSLFEIF